MKAGKLDRRVTIEVMGPATDDGLRAKAGGWFKLCDRWAALSPLGGAERIAAGEGAAFQMQKFRFRRSASLTITPDRHRLRYRGQIFDIVAVEEASGKEAWDVTASARADTADGAEAE